VNRNRFDGTKKKVGVGFGRGDIVIIRQAGREKAHSVEESGIARTGQGKFRNRKGKISGAHDHAGE